jgi:hypothetical protein
MKNTTTTARDARALDPWAFPSSRPEYDIRELVGDFETVGAAKAERDLRVRHLRTAGSIEHQAAGRQTRILHPNARCRSAACPICCRRLRMWFSGAVLELLSEIPDPIAATLIPGGQAVPTGDLRDFSPKRFGDMLRQQLRRAGAGSHIIVGGIDGDYDEIHQLWQPHFILSRPRP